MGLQMSSKNISVKVENLSKCYNIYNRPQDRLKQSIYPKIQTLLRKTPSVYYHEFWALNQISFEVSRGETIGIIGRNGSGKSTLLQLISGTLTPTTGHVQAGGRIAALLELGSGFNPEFTGRENVYMNAAILGLSKRETDEKFTDIAAFADIGEFIEHPVKIYSSGMVIRLAFAVQTMLDPDILIVDEALAVGDEKFQRKCFRRLDELKKQGTTILFVSHSGPQIIESCDKAILLEHGKRILFSDPVTTIRAYQKLIYAQPDEQERLICEYQEMDRQFSSDQKLILETSTSNVMEQYIGQIREFVTEEDFFDSGLVPETTQTYPMLGAKIEKFQVSNAEGKIVNNLLPHHEYKFEMIGTFLEDREMIYFGLQIRSVSGLVVGGQRYPEEGNYFDSVRKGQRFHLTCNFKMSLVPGTYFVGGGVWSLQEPNCLHRILDSIMFRILPKAKSGTLGFVDLSSQQPQVTIEGIRKQTNI
jgi:lipopolysaccharide transport system ATP-binding protein